MQQYAKNACVCIKNRHNAYTEGNGAYAYARVGTSIYIAAVCIKKLLSRQVYATKEEYAYVCTCIEPYATGHKSHAIRAQTALISGAFPPYPRAPARRVHSEGVVKGCSEGARKGCSEGA